MFRQIFLFELKYRLRRPGVYLCFLAALAFPFLSFSLGALPANDKEFFNSPSVLAFFTAVTSMMMMLISSAIMGVPLYRDIEYNTRDYYLSYPITKAGYFWGRYCGSFFFVLLIAAAIPLGAWLGSLMGPAAGWQEASKYGPQRLIWYLHPYLTIAIPNLIFTSSLFFSLVAATRNVKVIYSSGIILFLGYLLSNFVLHGTRNMTVINLSDPFAIIPVKLEINGYSLTQKNNSLVSIHGSFLVNRLLWPGVGLLILFVIYARFSFERFFSGRADKKASPGSKSPAGAGRLSIPAVQTRFTGSYTRQTLSTLTRVEILNIIRDNYFWIILSCGAIFLCFAFANTWNHHGMQDFPGTALLTYIFNDNFLFFVFIILIFYTGETVHREKVTRFAAINDALPPPDWILSFSKLFSLLAMAAFLALLPIVLGMGVQLAKGYTQFNFPVYFTNLFAVTLPLFTAMVLFSYMLHTVISNKFAAHGIGITIWVGMFLLRDSGKMDYLLFLYSYTPQFRWSDMDGMGHMLRPVLWFNVYWLLCGGLFLVLATLYFNRGVSVSFRERKQLARGRWSRNTKLAFVLLLAGFLSAGSYIYYNISVLNDYVTRSEWLGRRAVFEKELKHYEAMPLPKVTKVRLYADLFPEDRKALVHAYISIANRAKTRIDSILLDGDNLREYSLKYNGTLLSYSSPLSYSRGKFNWWRPAREDAGYRLYRLPGGLAPGDTAMVEIRSVVAHEGFTNNLSDPAFLFNGTLFNGGLPGLGYDAGDELSRADERKEYHLPVKKQELIPQGDPRGTDNLSSGSASDLFSLDLTVSTSGDETVVAPGLLQKEWKDGGRNYYHYTQDRPGMYAHFAMLSARYAVLHDSVSTEDGRRIPVMICYHPAHGANLDRFLAACKEGLRHYSHAYGPYPFESLSLVEASVYGPETLSMPGVIVYSENFGWNTHFTDPGQWDFCYAVTAAQVAGQWWGQQVASNNTTGSGLIQEGLAEYSMLALEGSDPTERAGHTGHGPRNIREAIQQELNDYNFWKWIAQRRNESNLERPLLKADKDYILKSKAAIVLYGLARLLGRDSLHAALRAFQAQYAFRDRPPFAGSDDLYRVLEKQVPDSLRYYLTDSWEKVTVYDNKVLSVAAVPFGKGDQYKVTVKISVGKAYLDSAGNEHSAEAMNDYIDIGVFGSGRGAAQARAAVGAVRGRAASAPGGEIPAPLYMGRHRFVAGEHTLELVVHGKPAAVRIDPDGWLMDRDRRDNEKKL